MMEILKQNTGLLVMTALLLGGLLVSGLFALLMSRSGASLRPILFFLVFFLLVVLPQAIGHLAMAVKPGTAPTQPVEQRSALAVPGLPRFTIAVSDGRVAEPEQVFGPAMPGAQFEDSRALFASRMPGLQVANTAALPTGETITALVFGTEAEATDGLLAYLGLYQVAVELDRGGAEVKGTRGLGQDRMHLLRSGNAVLIATALTDAQLQARIAAIPMLRSDAPLTASGEDGSAATAAAAPLVPALQPLRALFAPA
jgi:hypothetical protein